MAKLVRDKIPEIIKGDGKEPIFYIADSDEYSFTLLQKLNEEVEEFRGNNNVEELADIMEVIYAIAEHKVFGKEKLESIRLIKASERGIFKNRFILKGIR